MNTKQRKELMALLAGIKDPQLMDQFMEDILTPSELDNIIVRWQIVKRLAKGEAQRKIAKQLGISIAKITRGSRELRDKNGGFNKVLKIHKI